MTDDSKWFAVARDQLFRIQEPSGEVGHYLRGLAGDSDVTVRVTRNTYERVTRFLNGDDPDDDLSWGLYGEAASNSGDGRVSAGTSVEVWMLSSLEWTPTGDPRCFHITGIGDDDDGTPVFAVDDQATAT